ncbi:MAG: GAF domain-containing protein [Rhizobiaceae bacterium]|nr:GAF domain-containing protein [Rhizobiaceae bacterium]
MNSKHVEQQETDLDLTTCDLEPIHIPGRIQSFGALVSITPDLIVNHASKNAARMLAIDCDTLVGRSLLDFISPATIHDMRSRLQMLASNDAVERMIAVTLTDGGSPFDIALHVSVRSIVLEFEPHNAQAQRDYISDIRHMIERLRQAVDVVQLCQMAARQIKILTGFDRVMVYRFGRDGSGNVIAEAVQRDMEPYLGLRYPASGIPKQARALYTRNLLRLIGDAHDEGIAIEPVLSAEGEPLDLSMSTTRSVSPIHLEYLRNMGVHASMSISILRKGKLWGLIACHNQTPLSVSFSMRLAAELFAQLFGFLLEQKEASIAREDAIRSRILHDQIMAKITETASVENNVGAIIASIESAIPFDGAISWTNGIFRRQGTAPSQEEFLELLPFIDKNTTSGVFQTECLSDMFPLAKPYAAKAAGLLVVPFRQSSRDYIVLFRSEVAKSLRWAGNPDKPAERALNATRLTPRKSFEEYKQQVRGHCSSWTTREMNIAEALRVTLMEVALKLAFANDPERHRLQEHQELLISELNHRVRNILNLVKGPISQSSDEASSVSGFTEIIGGRVHALARAHDQIMRKNGAAASAHGLIETEASAYLAADATRVELTGSDALLVPKAFSTLSLVIHELMTNSAKYGALSERRGRVFIKLSQETGDELRISWRESDGPQVVEPTRRGFGLTIIERSIPYELHGQATLNFDKEGVNAVFVLPADSVETHLESALSEAVIQEAAAEVFTPPNSVLVVEDNIIIALDAEIHLDQLGAKQVQIASTVTAAMELVETNDFDFALLDVNLGSETSEPLAHLLMQKGVPFAFASGYGELQALAAKFNNAPIVQKPYDKNALVKAIVDCRQET